MPNWCECDLVVEGPTSDVNDFLNAITQEDEKDGTYYSILATQVPKPDILDRTVSPIEIVDTQEEADEINEKYKDGNGPFGRKENGIRAMTQATKDHLMATYGAHDWYEWAWNNWGTKWGDCDTYIDDEMSYEYDGETVKYITFSSAWSPPTEGFFTLSKKWPTLKFTMSFFESGMGFNGRYSVQNGEVLEDVTADYFGHRGG